MTRPAIREFRAGDEPAISAIIAATLTLDPLPGLTVQDLQHGVDRMSADPGETLVATEDGAVVGFCAPWMNELMVRPDQRRRGHGRRLVEAWVARKRAAGEPHLMLHGPDRPAAQAFIAALGFERFSSMWLFQLQPSVAVARPAFPPDVSARTFRDEDLLPYLELARASFADHPTPLPFSEAIVRRAHSLPDFDPGGILLVFPIGDPETPVAWTKARHEVIEATGERRGYVSFIGVLPEWRGRGLGRELLRWAIAFNRDAGAATIELNVEAANDRALALYQSTGFTAEVEWPHYVLRTGA